MSVATKSTKVYSQFEPSVIPNLRLWLDAADTKTFTLAGTKVSQWNDKSGCNCHVFESNDTWRPTYDAANRRLYFSNGSNQLSTPDPGARPANMFVVAQTLTLNKEHSFLRKGLTQGSDLEYSLRINSVNQIIAQYVRADSGQYSLVYVPTLATALQLISSEYASNASRIYLNGFEQGAAGTSLPTSFVATTGATNLRIGGVPSANNNTSGPTASTSLNGYIHEVMIFDRTLLGFERQAIEGYLINKWGLATVATRAQPYLYSSPVLRPFLPTDIELCACWFDATDQGTITYSSGSNVSRLRDKTSNAYDVSQSIVGQQPVLVQNIVGSLPMLRFTQASSTSLSNSSALSATFANNGTSFMLLERNMTAPTGNPGPFGFAAGPNSGIIFQYDLSFTGAFRPFTLSDQSFTSITPRFDYFNRANSTSIAAAGSINGTVLAVSDTTRGTYSNAFYVGRNANGYMSGDIGEIIGYNSNLTSMHRQYLEGYIAWKWGLVANLPSTHPFKRFRPLRAIATTPLNPVFSYIGAAQYYTVPMGATRIFVEMWGGGGVGAGAGHGAYLDGYLSVTPGETLKIVVARGGQLSNVGRSADLGNNYFSGGGASAVLRGSTYLAIAGGGGAGPGGGTRNNGGSGGLDRSEKGWAESITYATQTAGGGSSIGAVGALYIANNTNGGAGYYSGGDTNGTGGGGSSYYSLLQDAWGERGINFYNGYSSPPNTKSAKYSTPVAKGGGQASGAGGNGLVWVTPIFTTPATRTDVGRFQYTGSFQTYVVPSNVTKLHIMMWGAAGGGKTFTGGLGNVMEGVVTVIAGSTLQVVVGKGGSLTPDATTEAQGWGGVGTPSGGGFSGIRYTGGRYLAVAAGGGAGGTSNRGGHGGNTYQAGQNVTNGGFGAIGGGTEFTDASGIPYATTSGGAGGGDGSSGQDLRFGLGSGGAGGLGTGCGGGGGYRGGGGGPSSGLYGGGGGASLTAPNTYISTMHDEEVSMIDGSLPNASGSFYYKTGVGTAGPNKAGGNGLVIILPIA